jgi:hypothetical protein
MGCQRDLKHCTILQYHLQMPNTYCQDGNAFTRKLSPPLVDPHYNLNKWLDPSFLRLNLSRATKWTDHDGTFCHTGTFCYKSDHGHKPFSLPTSLPTFLSSSTFLLRSPSSFFPLCPSFIQPISISLPPSVPCYLHLPTHCPLPSYLLLPLLTSPTFLPPPTNFPTSTHHYLPRPPFYLPIITHSMSLSPFPLFSFTHSLIYLPSLSLSLSLTHTLIYSFMYTVYSHSLP